MECERCGLSKTRKNIVVGRGDPTAKVWFVGEAPGNSEDARGIPFVGASGKELNKVLDRVGLGQGSYYITNVVRCRPTSDGFSIRPPTPEEKAVCGEYLKADLEAHKPPLVVALGKHAAEFLIGPVASVMAIVGRTFDYEYGKVFVLPHPAYILRNPRQRAMWEATTKKLGDMIEDSR